MSFRRQPAAFAGAWLTRLLRGPGTWGARPRAHDIGVIVDPAHVRSILVLKPHDQLGDFMAATPALAALRARFPAARITLLTRAFLADLARAQPDVDEVLVQPRVSGPGELLAVARTLFAVARLRPDLAFVFNSVSRSKTADALAALSRARLVVGRSRVGMVRRRPTRRSGRARRCGPPRSARRPATACTISILKSWRPALTRASACSTWCAGPALTRHGAR